MIELKNSKTTYLGKASGGDRYALDAFIGAVQMREPEGPWQDIKPRLVRDTGGWRVEGAPYYAEVKDDGSRLFYPDRNERGQYVRLPSVPLFSGLTKSVGYTPAMIDGEVLTSKVVMPASYGSLAFQFTNTGMYLPIEMNSEPKVAGKAIDRLTLDIDSSYDIAELLKSSIGFGIVPGYIEDAKGDHRKLEWSYKNGQLELGFDLTGLAFPVRLMDAIDVQVGAGADDGGRSGGSSFSATQTYQTIGQAAADYDAFFRFTGVTLGGAIDTSYVQLYSNYQLGTPALKVYGVDADNPAAPTTLAEFDAQALTTAAVDWDGAFTDEAWNTSPSLNAIFQELVDTYTISGDAVIVKIRDDQASNSQYNQVRTYNYGSGYGARLHIEYTTGGATGKTSAEAGSGTDAMISDNPVVVTSGGETGSGLDAKGDYPAALLSGPETGAGIDAGNPAIAASPESGSGTDISALLAVLLEAVESGSGSELAVPGMDSTGLTASDSGGGIESVIDRWLELIEAGALAEAAAVIAALIRSESGAGLETAAATIGSSDGGAGIDLGALLKTALSGDNGGGYDALKSLVKIEGSSPDRRLYTRRGQGQIPSGRERMPSKQSRKPSKGVNI